MAAASLTSFAALSINGKLHGLYIAIEDVSDSFLERNYGESKGALYKPETERLANAGGEGGIPGGNGMPDGIPEGGVPDGTQPPMPEGIMPPGGGPGGIFPGGNPGTPPWRRSSGRKQIFNCKSLSYLRRKAFLSSGSDAFT